MFTGVHIILTYSYVVCILVILTVFSSKTEYCFFVIHIHTHKMITASQPTREFENFTFSQLCSVFTTKKSFVSLVKSKKFIWNQHESEWYHNSCDSMIKKNFKLYSLYNLSQKQNEKVFIVKL